MSPYRVGSFTSEDSVIHRVGSFTSEDAVAPRPKFLDRPERIRHDGGTVALGMVLVYCFGVLMGAGVVLLLVALGIVG